MSTNGEWVDAGVNLQGKRIMFNLRTLQTMLYSHWTAKYENQSKDKDKKGVKK